MDDAGHGLGSAGRATLHGRQSRTEDTHEAIAAPAAGYTDEQALDAVGTAIVAGPGLTKTVDDAANTITLARDLVSVQSFFVPAVAMKPRTTNGPGVGTTETTTNDINFDTLDFDSSVQEAAQFLFRMPKSVNEAGNFTASFGWLAGAASGGVRWGIRWLVLRDGSTLDTAVSGGNSLTDNAIGTGVLHVTAVSGPGVITGLTAEDVVLFEVYRDVAHAGDTMAGDAKLLWLDIKIPFNGYDDA